MPKVRDRWAIANWKMNLLPSQTAGYLERLRARLQETQVSVAVCPPYPHLPAATAAAAGSRIRIGAQNLSDRLQGAFTGEVSAAMLQDVGVSLVLVGHSERRRLFGEDDALVAAKMRVALEHGLCPVVCVGEGLQERKVGQTQLWLQHQLQPLWEVAQAFPQAPWLIAYEPIWAIGTGEAATPSIAQETIAFIRVQAEQHLGDIAATLSILYGGSVDPGNASPLALQPAIDGFLVGGASLNPEAFAAIAEALGAAEA
ncbi:MAG: triose-phosphate isomerase [Firmicutes bacterium]|nr:triose-phosphate isomerase [Bacillota bacterium]